jgi:hypothetical protein
VNKEFVLYNLTEAHKALDDLISDMKSDPEYDYGAYIVDIAHVYQMTSTLPLRATRGFVRRRSSCSR